MYRLFVLALVLSACAASRRQPARDAAFVKDIDTILVQSARQYKVLAATLPPGKFPRSWNPKTGQLVTSGSEWWCSGFYPGTLLRLFGATQDSALYFEAQRMLGLLQGEEYNTSTHDLGFMMFCSFGNALRYDPKPETKAVLLQSARSLATRFDPKVGAIRSWNGKPGEYLVIIDNMMNLRLLLWAFRETGDSSFYRIATTHANTTLHNHFRPDGSSYHVLNYDSATGAVLQKRTAQGYSNASAWARGQAWGLYGYTELYELTGREDYLRQARAIAAFLVHHPRLPADGIPYWDFDAPDIPNAPRDASAGAIMASALLKLSEYGGDAAMDYCHKAEKILKTLSGLAYRAAPGDAGGFLLKHSVGHLPAGSEVDVSLTYADYYFVEALGRYHTAQPIEERRNKNHN